MHRIIISLLIVLCSCSETIVSSKYRPGICLMEINKRYVASAKLDREIYKINEVKRDGVKISVFHQGGWQYLGAREEQYFNETTLFNYQQVDCPDGSDKLNSITDKIKDISL